MEFEIFKEIQECHECGKMERNRKVVWLNHLCQHYFALCPKCWIKLAKVIFKSNKTGK
jgi:hypothetical protein